MEVVLHNTQQQRHHRPPSPDQEPNVNDNVARRSVRHNRCVCGMVTRCVPCVPQPSAARFCAVNGGTTGAVTTKRWRAHHAHCNIEHTSAAVLWDITMDWQ